MGSALSGGRYSLLEGTQSSPPSYVTDGVALHLLASAGTSDWVQNAVADPTVQVEIDGEIHSGFARVVADEHEADRARTLVFERYAPRSGDDLSEWRDRATPIAIELT